MKVFIEALLAKQVWRIMIGGEMLLHKILRSKYFPKCSIFEALGGWDGGFTWLSMWGAEALLLEGLRWSVVYKCAG